MADRHRPRPLGPDRAAVYRLAGAASCDPRTAARWLRGERVPPLVAARIVQAARAIGVPPPPPQPEPEARGT